MRPGGIYSDPVPLSQFLSINGDGTGATNAIVDYSGGEVYYIQPAAGEIMEIRKLTLHIVDSGALPAAVYGGLGAALTTGIDIVITNEGSIARSVLPGLIQANDDLAHLGNGGVELLNFTGGVDTLTAHLDFREIMGTPHGLILDGDRNHKLEVLFEDSFVGLNDHHFIAHGTK